MNALKIKINIMLHIRENIALYLLVVFVFITGVAAGGFTVSSISAEQRLYLADYLQGYSYILGNQPHVDRPMIFIKAMLQNVQTAFFIWLFGLSYLSTPLVLITVGIRGFFLGFTVAFLIDYYAFNGLFMVLTCILPQSFIHIPCLMVMGVLALQFGIERFKIRKLPHLKQMRLRRIAPYTFKFVLIIIAFFISSLFEAFVVPLVFKFLFANMLKVKDFITFLPK
ncbi:MAG: stage sporulation protein [Clostridiales bacterium]|nr:stage sporulation protein [Clostridiales bacterium]